MTENNEKQSAAQKRAAAIKKRQSRQVPALNKERGDYVQRIASSDDAAEKKKLTARVAQVEAEITARGGKVNPVEKSDEKAAQKAAKSDADATEGK